MNIEYSISYNNPEGRKQLLIMAFDEDGTSNSNSIIAQGRELLANAAAHSQQMEEYTHGKDIFSIATSSKDELESEQAAKARLNELLQNVKTLQTNAERTPKKVSNFDPSSMNVAKRSEHRVNSKPREELKVSSFKALPLPGNTPVRNNPLAMTKSFEQKIGSVDRLIRLNNEDTASVVTSVASVKNEMSFHCHEDEEHAEHARQIRAKKNLLKRNLLDEVNKILLKEGSLGDDVSIVQGEGDRVEDPSILTQQISQLESKLKHEKTQRLAILNDIVDIDLNAIFYRLITEDAGEDAKNIIDRLKNKIYESVHDFESYSVESSQEEEIFGDMKPPTLYARQEEWVKRRDQKRFEAKMQLEADTMRDITGKPELGDAKRSWVMAKEAHEQALERAQQNATPNKFLNKDAEKDKGRELKFIDWQKAKESHDQALKRATEQEEMKRKAREEKDAAARKEEIQYLGAIDTSAAVESKAPKKERPQQSSSSSQSREDQRKSSVRLIEQTRRRSKLVQQEEIFHRSKSIENDALSESIRKTESNINDFSGVSYAEMSEKEFKKLVKRISTTTRNKMQ